MAEQSSVGRGRMRSDKVECGCGMMYDKQGIGWLNNPILNEEGCGRTGECMLGWMNNQV